MAYQTLSENIVAALITTAQGDLPVNLGKAVAQLNLWQQVHACHFGTCRADVGSSLALLWYSDPKLSGKCRSASEVLERLTLADVLPMLLDYKHWYANDEGAYWDEASAHQLKNGRTFHATSFRTFRLKQYTQTLASKDAAHMLQFLNRFGLDETHLRRCARPGDTS